MAAGKTAEQVEYTKSLPVLHDVRVHPIVEVFKWLQSFLGQEIVKKATTLCRAGEWDLSGDVLVSRKARSALHEYLKTDSILRDEIASKIGAQTFIELDEDAELNPNEDHNTDDTDVLSSAVIREALGLTASITDQSTDVQLYCVKNSDVTVSGQGFLQGGGPREDIWELTSEDLIGNDTDDA